MDDGVEQLKTVIAGLEVAVDAHLERAAREREQMAVLRAEVEALRSMQRSLAQRLDAAIAQLKAQLER